MNWIIRQVLSAVRALQANLIRSALTMLGIVIGVASVIMVLSVGKGTEQLIISQVSTIGTNLIGILPGKSDESGPPAAVYGFTIRTLTTEDVDEIQKIPGVVGATGYVTSRGQFTHLGTNFDADLVGVDEDYVSVEDTLVDQGRFFTSDEIRRHARVMVLGSTVKEKLFGDINPIGEEVRFQDKFFTVIGVMRPRGTAFFVNMDERCYAPLLTVQKDVLGIDYVAFARAKFADPKGEPQIRASIENLLRRRHRINDPSKDDFSVRGMSQGLDILKGISGSISAFLLAIVAISLLVGGIGIMNIMFVVVTERYQEIGIRKAVGASNSSIRNQFIIESAVLAGIGGIVGLVFGVVLSVIIGYFIHRAGYEWQYIFAPGDILLAVSVSAGVGLLSGLYPALRAGKLSITDAMRQQ